MEKVNSNKARLIAYYLPQFHPVPENDKHWGKGFTEWTNVAKARPLFKGHHQPFLPTELGYYDLRVPEVRKAQTDLAKEYGIEGFCYWHYWFGGKRVLEMPFDEVVKSGEPDFPFCLCWANHSWNGTWIGDEKMVVFEQTYSGIEDYTRHFYELLPAFRDNRYIKVGGKLLFSLFAPRNIPDCKFFIDTWQQLALKEGLAGFHFVGMGEGEDQYGSIGLDGYTSNPPINFILKVPVTWKDKITYRIFKKSFSQWKYGWLGTPQCYDYADIVKIAKSLQIGPHEYPGSLPNWDYSPRSKSRGYILTDSTPDLFGEMLRYHIHSVESRPYDQRIVFLKAWNEWAEGNFLEPEAKYGRGYLEVIKKVNGG
jgi:hypothetical protein